MRFLCSWIKFFIHTLFVALTSDIAESFSTILIVLIFNLLKVGHPCSVVDDPNARDNLMQVYGCQSGIDKFVSQKNWHLKLLVPKNWSEEVCHFFRIKLNWFLSDPGPIIVYPSQWLTDSQLTNLLKIDVTTLLKIEWLGSCWLWYLCQICRNWKICKICKICRLVEVVDPGSVVSMAMFKHHSQKCKGLVRQISCP